MVVKRVFPKDICVDIELRLVEIKSILDIADRLNIRYDSENEPEFAKSVGTFKKLVEELQQLEKELDT